MQKTLWLIMPLVMSGCMLEREHDHDHDYDSSWGYETSLELEGRHDSKGRSTAGAGADSCVVTAGRDASLSDSERAPSEDSVRPSCQSNGDCEDKTYCEQDSGECLPAIACEDESSCDPGFNCDPERSLCMPADLERCSELTDEAACAERSDCISRYAGIDCSCGPDCTCMGGEPNCVCERFEFHACADVTESVQ